MTDEQYIEVTARLTAYDFLAELLLANLMHQMRPEDAQAFVADVKRVSKRTWSREEVADADQALAIAMRSSEVIAHVLDKALRRSGQA